MQGPIAQSVMPARHTGAERFREGKGIVAGIADFNLPEQLPRPSGIYAIMGLPLSAIAWLLHVSAFPVLRWARNFAECVYEKPEPGEVAVVDPDEM